MADKKLTELTLISDIDPSALLYVVDDANVSYKGTMGQLATGLINNFEFSAGDTISGVSITGGIAITGALNINAGSNISLTQAGLNTFSITSSTNATTTNGVTGLSITGGVAISGALLLNTGYNITIVQEGLKTFTIGSMAGITFGTGNPNGQVGGTSGNGFLFWARDNKSLWIKESGMAIIDSTGWYQIYQGLV